MSQLNKKTISFMMFDWGTSPITTIHTTFIFSVYFVNSIAIDNGTFFWACIVGFAGFLTALLGPIVGSYSDKKGNKKYFLLILTLIGCFSTSLLWFAKPEYNYFIFASLFSCISILSMELIFVLYNALLYRTSEYRSYGMISGLSWSAGYLGGIFSLFLCLIFFIFPDQLPFGVSKEDGGDVRSCMIFVSLWLLFFSFPIFYFVREPNQNKNVKNTSRYLTEGMKIIFKNKSLLRYFISRIIYFDALATLFAFGGIYAASVFKLTNIEILYFAILINISAAIGALVGGKLDDTFSPFKTIKFALIGLIIIGLILILTQNETLFWVISFFLGFFIGPLQSSSRVLITKIIPEEQGGQFFGFAIFSGKVTSFLGPLIYGSLVMLFDSQKTGMLFVIILFIIAFLILGKTEPQKINI